MTKVNTYFHSLGRFYLNHGCFIYRFCLLFFVSVFYSVYDALNISDEEDMCSLLYDTASLIFFMDSPAPAVSPSHFVPSAESSLPMR